MGRHFDDDDTEDAKPNWPVIRDLFGNLIEPAKDWNEADCLGDIAEMAFHFRQAYPEQQFTLEDLRFALHDLKIDYERNEHNNKYYYLAKWR